MIHWQITMEPHGWILSSAKSVTKPVALILHEELDSIAGLEFQVLRWEEMMPITIIETLVL